MKKPHNFIYFHVNQFCLHCCYCITEYFQLHFLHILQRVFCQVYLVSHIYIPNAFLSNALYRNITRVFNLIFCTITFFHLKKKIRFSFRLSDLLVPCCSTFWSWEVWLTNEDMYLTDQKLICSLSKQLYQMTKIKYV